MIAALIAAAGLSLQLPAGWHALRLPGTVPVVDPIIPLVVSSAAIRRSGRPCQVGQFAPRPSAVTIVIVEWRRHYAATRWSPRPHRFGSNVLPLRMPAIECFSGRGGSVAFSEKRRRFGVYLMAGRRARASLVRRARLVLDTLRVSRRR